MLFAMKNVSNLLTDDRCSIPERGQVDAHDLGDALDIILGRQIPLSKGKADGNQPPAALLPSLA
jgi:hypothetical protein